MAHPQQLRFVELVRQHFGPQPGSKVLEIGSYDVNGSVRAFFKDCDYLGADLAEGPGVDRVGSGHDLDFKDSQFDAVLSCECFEHNPYWAETFLNMVRMVRAGGIVAMTCASKGRAEHGTTRTDPGLSPGTSAVGIDYYLNLNAVDFKRRFDLKALFQNHRFFYHAGSRDLYFVGWKKGAEAPADLAAFEADVQAIEDPERDQAALLLRLRRALMDLPVWVVMQSCPDPFFQNFSMAYARARVRLAAFVRTRMLGRPKRS